MTVDKMTMNELFTRMNALLREAATIALELETRSDATAPFAPGIYDRPDFGMAPVPCEHLKLVQSADTAEQDG